MKKLTTHGFIEKSKEVHGCRYSYLKSVYKTSRDKIIVTCKKHGDFELLANSHMQGTGCKQCFHESHYEKLSKRILSDKFKGLIQPEDYKLIPLTKGKFTKVDNEDFNRVKDINWCYAEGYATNANIGLIHRFIMNTPVDMNTDHINHDTLDNRKCNLRICTQSQNMANVFTRSKKSSIYKGVYWNKKESKWYSQIKHKKTIYLGAYTSEIKAARAYDKKAKELFGEFARLNLV